MRRPFKRDRLLSCLLLAALVLAPRFALAQGVLKIFAKAARVAADDVARVSAQSLRSMGKPARALTMLDPKLEAAVADRVAEDLLRYSALTPAKRTAYLNTIRKAEELSTRTNVLERRFVELRPPPPASTQLRPLIRPLAASSALARAVPAGTTVVAQLDAARLMNFLTTRGGQPARRALSIASTYQGPMVHLRTTRPIVLQRIYGGDSKPLGSWYFLERIVGTQSRYALPPGNTISNIAEIEIPAGRDLILGEAGPLFQQPGGGMQFFAPRIEGFQVQAIWERKVPGAAVAAAVPVIFLLEPGS